MVQIAQVAQMTQMTQITQMVQIAPAAQAAQAALAAQLTQMAQAQRGSSVPRQVDHVWSPRLERSSNAACGRGPIPYTPPPNCLSNGSNRTQ